MQKPLNCNKMNNKKQNNLRYAPAAAPTDTLAISITTHIQKILRICMCVCVCVCEYMRACVCGMRILVIS